MAPASVTREPGTDRPSRLIAEALVKRYGPNCILERASQQGLSPRLTRVVIAACGATAIEPYRSRGR